MMRRGVVRVVDQHRRRGARATLHGCDRAATVLDPAAGHDVDTRREDQGRMTADLPATVVHAWEHVDGRASVEAAATRSRPREVAAADSTLGAWIRSSDDRWWNFGERIA